MAKKAAAEDSLTHLDVLQNLLIFRIMDRHCGGVILINDVQGCKFDGKVVSKVKKFLSGSASPSTVHVLRGELLVEVPDSDDFNYKLYRDQSIYLFCTEVDVAPLNYEEFLILEPIKEPGDKLDVFQHKFEWGAKLREGSHVLVTLPGPNLALQEHVRAVVHYKGKIGYQQGIFYGVEILVSFFY